MQFAMKLQNHLQLVVFEAESENWNASRNLKRLKFHFQYITKAIEATRILSTSSEYCADILRRILYLNIWNGCIMY